VILGFGQSFNAFWDHSLILGAHVAFFDQTDDRLSALFWSNIFLLFNLLCRVGHFIVVDCFTEPGGIITLPEMIPPGLIVNPFGELDENLEIVRPQVEFALRSAEKEGSVLRNLAFNVFSLVALVLGLRRLAADPDGFSLRFSTPGNRFARF
jgi:hypothetical protein